MWTSKNVDFWTTLLQGTLKYEIIGDDSAPYYFSFANTLGVPAGRIILRNDLKTESKELYHVSANVI